MIHSPIIAREPAQDQDVLAELQAHREALLAIVQAVERTIAAVEWNRTGALRGLIAQHAERAGVSVAAVIGPKRRADLNAVRQAVMAEAHKQGFSLNQIGRALGGRDHTTVSHGIRVHRARAEPQIDQAGRLT